MYMDIILGPGKRNLSIPIRSQLCQKSCDYLPQEFGRTNRNASLFSLCSLLNQPRLHFDQSEYRFVSADIANHTTLLHLQTKESVHIHQTPFPLQRVGSGNETIYTAATMILSTQFKYTHVFTSRYNIYASVCVHTGVLVNVRTAYSDRWDITFWQETLDSHYFLCNSMMAMLTQKSWKFSRFIFYYQSQT